MYSLFFSVMTIIIEDWIMGKHIRKMINVWECEKSPVADFRHVRRSLCIFNLNKGHLKFPPRQGLPALSKVRGGDRRTQPPSYSISFGTKFNLEFRRSPIIDQFCSAQSERKARKARTFIVARRLMIYKTDIPPSFSSFELKCLCHQTSLLV